MHLLYIFIVAVEVALHVSGVFAHRHDMYLGERFFPGRFCYTILLLWFVVVFFWCFCTYIFLLSVWLVQT
jgi:hypothetical protein